MKKILCPLMAILLISPAIAQSGIHFEKDTFASILAKAKRDHKVVFVDCFTTWCGPCKWMDKNVFPNDTVGNYYNDHFICASFDMEKGEGFELKKRYDVRCFPTYLYINENGDLLHRVSGSCSVSQFVAIGATALSTESHFAAIEKKCARKNATPEDLFRYIVVRSASCLPVDSVLSVYSQTQADTNFSNRQNWTVLTTYLESPVNRMFRYLLDHQQEFSAKYTKDSVEFVINRVYGSAMSRCFIGKNPDTSAYRILRGEVINLNLQFTDRLVTSYDMNFYTVADDWNGYAKTASAYIRNYGDSDALVLNNIAWVFYENVTDTAYLDTAILWAARSVALDPMYYNTDTYAALLYKRGRKAEALVMCERALSLAEEAGVDAVETQELRKKSER